VEENKLDRMIKRAADGKDRLLMSESEEDESDE
jgi:hypothetical protein